MTNEVQSVSLMRLDETAQARDVFGHRATDRGIRKYRWLKAMISTQSMLQHAEF
jgi:hypothetical protein